jgi:phytoene dehydrogenase-like protein
VRVTVVGAGLGGLAVACRLAALGHRVTVHERADVVGGKIGTYVRGGEVWDTGPSLLTLPAYLRETFDACGGWPPELTLKRISPVLSYRLRDGSWTDSDSLGWDDVLDRGRRVWDASHGPYLESVPSLAGLARSLSPAALRAIAPGRTLAGVARRLDPARRDVLWRYATYAGADPRRAPAALVSIPWVEHAYGGWAVAGGMRRLVDAFERRARDLGVIIEFGSSVDPRTLDGVVVSNVPVSGGRPSYSAFALLLALDDPPPMARHTVLFPADYRAEFDDLAAGRDVADPALYVHAPTPHRWMVLVDAPAGSGADRSDTVLRALAARGIDVRDRLRHSAFRTPLDIESGSGAPGGAIYGTTGWRRPPNRGPGGVLRVGGTTHPGGGIPLVLLSARITAGLVGAASSR